ncbi:Transport protein particle (TRAPP) [Angomonas deanei]|uniref:Trafficking protein particle complex subunit n=1 Tax=Angomonas deanei TaxID=59799 RepID=A0A7G2CB34_9TRYP|nr:Transport protein particle (TRAPP) [Angomonas deanei]CAD2216114.1 Sybindin-like family/Sedlin, N-terminal conserved region containing protein, putative [Angomonas deanei]|eukprot:EPY37639.1 Transport protein particle (TRAPP) [Angomonas deanei]
MVVHLLWMINQSGQLIARTPFTEPALLGELGTNADLQLTVSSVLFSTYGMSQELTPNASPIDCAGMNLIECEEHSIHIYETPTLVKIVLFTDKGTTHCRPLFRELYVAYVDYAVKNPFHVVDEAGIGQPIRVSVFSSAIRSIVGRYNSSSNNNSVSGRPPVLTSSSTGVTPRRPCMREAR